jgi:tetratricopeptide (TPR) repeat protein
VAAGLRRLPVALVLAALAALPGCAPEPARPDALQALAQDDAGLPELKLARDLVQAQQPVAAIGHLDQAIAFYEARYAGETRHLYCARGRDESILYSANAVAIKDPAGALVLPPYWADAYFMKGYILDQLGRDDEARAWLERARRLSPANAQYLSELGYNRQLHEDWKQSLDLYRKAEDASVFSPAPQQQHDLGRALRGQALALAGQGRFDESEKLYQRCLELDPDDAKARRGLESLRRQRAESGV